MNGTWMVAVLLWGALGAGAIPDKVPFTVLASGAQSGIDKPRTAVARTAAEWKTLCARHAAGQPCPPVDFSRSTALAIFLGTRPSAGYAVAITAVEPDGAALVVTYRERKPAPDDIVAQMITAPFQLATIARFAGEIRFVRTP
jgi:hypothetical protein